MCVFTILLRAYPHIHNSYMEVILSMMYLHLKAMKTRLLVECSGFLMSGVSLPCFDNEQYARKN